MFDRKFITFCLLIFTTLDNCIEAVEELSEDEMRLIAERLYPAECSRLLSRFSAARTRLADRRRYRDERIAENSRAQCLESLYECNQRGRSVGFTKKSLESALRRLGRADLVSRMKKRSKRRKIGKKTTRRKATRRRKKKPRAGRSDEEAGRKRKHYSRKKAVTSHAREPATKTGRNDGTAKEAFERRLMTFVVAGSVLVIVFLGCVVIVSYRRACRCYKRYLRCDNEPRDGASRLVDKFAGEPVDLGRSNKARRSISEARKNGKRKEEYENLISESDTERMNNLLESKNLADSPKFRSKNVSFDSAGSEEECKCGPVTVSSKRTMSPCARIKRFFATAKRRSSDANNFPEQTRDRRVKEKRTGKKAKKLNENAAKKSKYYRKKTRQCGKEKRANRERRKTIRSNRRDTEATRPKGCTCEMCKLFDVTDRTNKAIGGPEDFQTNNDKILRRVEKTFEETTNEQQY